MVTAKKMVYHGVYTWVDATLTALTHCVPSGNIGCNWLSLLLDWRRSCIKIPAWRPDKLIEVFHGFPQFLQADSGLVP